MGDLAYVAGYVPLRANLLGIRHGGGRALRRGARLVDGRRESPPLPSLRGQRLRSGDEAGRGKAFLIKARHGVRARI